MSGRPLIGVATYLAQARWGVWDRPAALLPAAYVEAVRAAGGVPLLLPVGGSADDAARSVATVDALVLPGGPDIEPARYGAGQQHPETYGVQPERDEWELALLAAALDQRRPVLGICRGMELMNVACGGDLVQHLPDLGASSDHRPAPGTYGRHSVRIDGAGPVAAALGPEVVVSSYHHQGIGRLGAGLRPVGWSEDGLVEAVEVIGADFGVGVLWHPEEQERCGGPGVFRALVRAATSPRS